MPSKHAENQGYVFMRAPGSASSGTLPNRVHISSQLAGPVMRRDAATKPSVVPTERCAFGSMKTRPHDMLRVPRPWRGPSMVPVFAFGAAHGDAKTDHQSPRRWLSSLGALPEGLVWPLQAPAPWRKAHHIAWQRVETADATPERITSHDHAAPLRQALMRWCLILREPRVPCSHSCRRQPHTPFLAPFPAVCRAEHRAEAWCIASPLQGLWLAKTRTFSRLSRA